MNHNLRNRIESKPSMSIVDYESRKTLNQVSLTRLSLTNMGLAPPWVLREILRHFPNLISFRIPFLDEFRVTELVKVLQESRIEQLSFSDQWMTDRSIANVIDSLLPANRSGQQLPPSRGLLSLTLDTQLDFEHGKRSLASHYPTLERISIVRCGASFDSQSELQLLEQCPQLETLLTIDPATESAPTNQSNMLTGVLRNPQVPTTEWSQLLFSGEILNNGDGQVEEDVDVTLAQMSMPQETLLLPRIRLSWPSAQTLRVLSLNLMIDRGIEAQRLLFYFTAIYKRFGQLEAMEDLALDCNAVFVEFDPWAGYDNQNRKKSEHVVPGRDFTVVSLECSLRHGLCRMDRLKRLKRLRFLRPSNTKVGRAEIEWMQEHWPRLESLPGVFVDGTQTGD